MKVNHKLNPVDIRLEEKPIKRGKAKGTSCSILGLERILRNGDKKKEGERGGKKRERRKKEREGERRKKEREGWLSKSE